MSSGQLSSTESTPSVVPLPCAVGPAGPSGERFRLLIVEDDPRSGRMLQANLAMAGYEVVLATSASHAQRVAAESSFDLVLCDLCLPDGDGIELTRWFRSQSFAARVPILIVTSSDDAKVLSRGLAAGADDFLTKPVSALELRARVKSLLRSRKLTAEEESMNAAEIAGARQVVTRPAVAEGEADTPAGEPIVLIVEDCEQQVRLLTTYVGQLGCKAQVAHSVADAIKVLKAGPPDLVLLDLLLPGADGYELIGHMKRSERWQRIPIVVTSVLADVAARVKALELGADDFILKGSERMEFDARVRRLLRVKRDLDQLSRNSELGPPAGQFDSLTGLLTQDDLRTSLDHEVSRARRAGEPLSLLYIDIDHLARINEQQGHARGDELLKLVAAKMRDTCRSRDILFRFRGEEFMVLLPQTTRDDAVALAHRLRKAVAMSAPGEARQAMATCVTISIGISTFPSDAADADALLQHADEAMYLAKNQGSDNVALFGEKIEASPRSQTILLVDDEEKNLRLLEAFLAPEGYQTLRAADGIEALEVARRERPDLILLDAMMPRLSGFDACRRLKQERATRLIPIVLVTALSGRDDKLRGMEAGADDFLHKPVDKLELLTRTRALLRAKQATDMLEDAETIIFTLAKAVEARDPSTGDHVERVARYAVALGQAVGLRGADLDGLRRAGIVHDIGKIAVPDAVLLKPGKLTLDEQKIIQQHVEAGYELLRPLRTFREALPAVRYHHERLNGSGYPFGLSGDEVPLSAQIMGVVDVYDALTSDRVYRAAMSHDKAAEVLRDEAARGFHQSELVETFLALAASEVEAQTATS